MFDKKIVFVILISFFLPSFLYFVTPNFLGYDSYYFLSEICGGNPIYTPDQYAPLINPILYALPCNELLLKLVLVCLFGCSLLTIYYTIALCYPKQGHWGILFACVSPILLYNSFKFENDAFGFPIMFISLYFFLKYLKNFKKNKLDLVFSIGLLLLSTLMWGGSIYYLYYFVLLEPLLIPLTIIPIIIIPTFLPSLITNVLPNFQVNESNPLMGMLSILFYEVFLIFPKTRKVFDFPFRKLTIITLIVGLINPKLMVLAIPLIAIVLVNALSLVTPETKKKMLTIAVMMNIGFALPIGLQSLHPTQIEHNAVQELLQLSQDMNKNYVNDWGYGHMVFYYRGSTQNHSTINNKLTEHYYDGNLVLTRKEFDCPILKPYSSNIGEGELKIYNC